LKGYGVTWNKSTDYKGAYVHGLEHIAIAILN